MARLAGVAGRRGFAAAAAALACLTGAARAQQPEWDATRHVLVVTSPLDSADVHAVLVAAIRGEGMSLERSDTLRGRLITVRRPSDSFGASGGTVHYLAMVHRVPGGGSRIYFGGLLQANPNTSGGVNPESFARRVGPDDTREGRDLFFLRPGSSPEWRRLERMAELVQRAGR